VEGKFGWHVIRCVERLAPNVLSMDARRSRFASETLNVRAKRDLDARMAALSKGLTIEISPAVDALLEEATAPPAP
jgi:hypothetical protein